MGVLAYRNDEPIGWCSIAPRETYGALERYKNLPRIDDTPVWSVVFFIVDSRFRRRSITIDLVEAAVRYARSQGADAVEGYPVEPGSRLYTYMGRRPHFKKQALTMSPPSGADEYFVMSPIHWDDRWQESNLA